MTDPYKKFANHLEACSIGELFHEVDMLYFGFPRISWVAKEKAKPKAELYEYVVDPLLLILGHRL